MRWRERAVGRSAAECARTSARLKRATRDRVNVNQIVLPRAHARTRLSVFGTRLRFSDSIYIIIRYTHTHTCGHTARSFADAVVTMRVAVAAAAATPKNVTPKPRIISPLAHRRCTFTITPCWLLCGGGGRVRGRPPFHRSIDRSFRRCRCWKIDRVRSPNTLGHVWLQHKCRHKAN